MDSNIHETILEWTNDGFEYLYEEQLPRMKQVERYLANERTYVDIIYRRTDWAPILNAQRGDLIQLTRVSSWSFSPDVPNQKYDGITSRLLILRTAEVRGIDVSDISSFRSEKEVLLAPCSLFIEKIDHDVIEAKYVYDVISDQ